jgi:hypothetical protein
VVHPRNESACWREFKITLHQSICYSSRYQFLLLDTLYPDWLTSTQRGSIPLIYMLLLKLESSLGLTSPMKKQNWHQGTTIGLPSVRSIPITSRRQNARCAYYPLKGDCTKSLRVSKLSESAAHRLHLESNRDRFLQFGLFIDTTCHA